VTQAWLSGEGAQVRPSGTPKVGTASWRAISQPERGARFDATF
jgi:hypothetical protein